ncbi:MAG: GlsB/YeaQ/YmgE family stress response membrane protein [Candidatus Sericytochromatia bacterium]|nr:GlsB/YeaQ/YmgE family stress response membrane protein [Candidatus Sericytochromatia bacterium]
MFGFIWMLLVAAIVGFLGDALAPGRMPGGWLGAVVAGIVGSAIGGYLFSAAGLPIGPVIAGFAMIPSIIGAALLVWLLSALAGPLARWGR